MNWVAWAIVAAWMVAWSAVVLIVVKMFRRK